MKRYRVLACTFACCPPGRPGFTGGEDILGWNLLKQISRRHEVWSLANEENRTSIEQALEEEPNPYLHFTYISLPRWLLPMLRIQGGHQIYYFIWQIQAFFAARNLHKNHNFDLFHHITYANDWAASYIGALLPIAYVRGPGGGAHRTPKGFEREYTLSGQIWEKIRALGQWILRRDPFYILGQRRSSAILICNQASLTAVPSGWSNKTYLFPVTGVSSADLAPPISSSSNKKPFRVLSAGSLIRVKGFNLAIRAFKEFAQRCPDTEFCIIGSGPEESRLRSLIQSSNLESKVHLVPHMAHTDLLSKMVENDVFLFPSLRDGGGAVVIEAMASGKPVVCLDTGGPGMHISGEWGYKITPSTPPQAILGLAEALECLYRNPDIREQLGKAARKRAEEFYHWDKLGDQLMEIYDKAISVDLNV